MAQGGRTGWLAERLETWFAAVKRPMPWRRRPSPYVCWLSEVMMQQTTYGAVLPYYRRFLKRFPTVQALAAAEEGEVLKAWEGLGYYARARHLLQAARQVAGKGRAEWPRTAEEWRRLPGIGPYSAAALASVLEGERVAVVDGNVARVFSRFWHLGDDFTKQQAREQLAERLRPEVEGSRVPGDFNQAMMELGACVCTPKGAACEKCPLKALCAGCREGDWERYPVKRERKALPIRRKKVVLVTDSRGRVLLVKNREGGLLKGLWELPTLEDGGEVNQAFTHFKLIQEMEQVKRTDAEFRDPQEVPLTTATRKALAQLLKPSK